MLGKVVAAGEAFGAERAGEALLPCVRPVVAGQLVGARKLLVTARPVAGKGALTWVEKAEGRETVVSGLRLGGQREGDVPSAPKATRSSLSSPPPSSRG